MCLFSVPGTENDMMNIQFELNYKFDFIIEINIRLTAMDEFNRSSPIEYPQIRSLDHILIPQPSQASSEIELPIIQPLRIQETPRITRFSYEPVVTKIKYLDILSTGSNGRTDDTYVPVQCMWYSNLIRLATIGDGNCFLHATLKGFDPIYQNNPNFRFRKNRTKIIRRDLAVKLSHPNPDFPEKTYWETINNGQFVSLTMQEIENEDLVGLYRRDYTLGGMQRLFNSYEYLGDEVYGYIADIFNVDIFVFRANPRNLKRHIHTVRPNRLRPVVAIVATGSEYGGHYETLGLQTPEGIQTNFAPDDLFVMAMLTLYGGLEALTYAPYDPDESFLANLTETFTTNGQFRLPLNKIEEIFSEYDPFVRTLNRLLPRIQQLGAIIDQGTSNQGSPIQESFTQQQTPSKSIASFQFDQLRPLLSNQGYASTDLNQIRDLIQAQTENETQLTLDYLLVTGQLGPEVTEILQLARIRSP